MNTTKILVVIVAFVFVLSSVGMVTSATAFDYTVDTSNQCTTPTKTINIAGGPGESYNVTPISVAKGACVAIAFHNADPSLDHTFTIDAQSSNNIALFNIYLKPGASKTLNFQAPNKDMTIKFYCAVPGHEAAGMVGQMKVGTGSSGSGTPGFEVIPLVFGLFVATGIVTTYRKRKN